METKFRRFMFVMMFSFLVTFSIYSHFEIQSKVSFYPSKQMIVKFVDYLNDRLDMNRPSPSIW